jgi:hypothetical protein
MSFASVYPLYVQKAQKKGRTKAEVDQVICWLTGHDAKTLQEVVDARTDLETFFANAPRFHPNAALIKGVVCGVRIEELEDETMRKIRYLDKLVDELAQGRPMEKILRSAEGAGSVATPKATATANAKANAKANGKPQPTPKADAKPKPKPKPKAKAKAKAKRK